MGKLDQISYEKCVFHIKFVPVDRKNPLGIENLLVWTGFYARDDPILNGLE